MTENKKKTFIIVGICLAVALVVAIVLFLLLGGSKEDGYRLIKLYQINGSASLERPGVGVMDATENIVMQDQDILSVMDKSSVRLQLDQDKYALAEENTRLSIEATGDEKINKTNINLVSGAVTIEIQNKLGSESSYQVTTPNSVMSVKGTVFRVAVTTDENGKPVAKLDVFEGKVTVRRVNVNEKGETVISDEEYSAEKGGQIIVYFSDDKEENIIKVNETPDYSDLNLDTLNYLKEIVDDRDLIFTEEEIQDMIMELLGQEQESEEESTEESSEDESEEESEEESQEENQEESQEESQEAGASSGQQVAAVKKPSTESTESSSAEESGSVEESGSEAPSSYTVTFMYNGTTFATQTVEAGGTATKPKMQPAVSGSWDFDFTTSITGDTSINWK